VTYYVFQPIHDKDYPHTKLFNRKFHYTKDVLEKALTLVNDVAKDQEAQNLRDLFVLADYGHFPHIFDFLPDIPLLGPLSNYFDFEKDQNVYVDVIGLWTGIDSGELTDYWYDRYLKPFDLLNPIKFPTSFTLHVPLSIATSPAMTFDTLGETHRRHLASIHSDYWWSDEFISILAEEFDRRTKLPGVMLTVQYFPRGYSSQWFKNAGLNTLPWRDTRPFMDDWYMYKNESQSDEIAQNMNEFYTKHQKHWIYSDGTIRNTFMSPQTIYPHATDLTNPATAKQYFPDATVYQALRSLKTLIDPTGIFSSPGTIPIL
jgi:hypothetical protein